ncbi:VF530 family DNA-binding protein [Aquimarina muelleri]|uniref:VF530 family DNA-binding protein n=1 Tax=Aquimarina muelleri TaxID=279356 RepID=UPI003F682E4A
MDNKDLNKEQPNNPLHGLKLAYILEFLVEYYGWERLAMKININCFKKIHQLSLALNF